MTCECLLVNLEECVFELGMVWFKGVYIYIYIGHIDIVVIDECVNNKVWKLRDWFRNEPKL